MKTIKKNLIVNMLCSTLFITGCATTEHNCGSIAFTGAYGDDSFYCGMETLGLFSMVILLYPFYAIKADYEKTENEIEQKKEEVAWRDGVEKGDYELSKACLLRCNEADLVLKKDRWKVRNHAAQNIINTLESNKNSLTPENLVLLFEAYCALGLWNNDAKLMKDAVYIAQSKNMWDLVEQRDNGLMSNNTYYEGLAEDLAAGLILLKPENTVDDSKIPVGNKKFTVICDFKQSEAMLMNIVDQNSSFPLMLLKEKEELVCDHAQIDFDSEMKQFLKKRMSISQPTKVLVK